MVLAMEPGLGEVIGNDPVVVLIHSSLAGLLRSPQRYLAPRLGSSYVPSLRNNLSCLEFHVDGVECANHFVFLVGEDLIVIIVYVEILT